MNEKKLEKMFPITSVCRADILGEGYLEEFVEKLTDDDMEYIARKLADAFVGGDYWVALNNICDNSYPNKTKK